MDEARDRAWVEKWLINLAETYDKAMESWYGKSGSEVRRYRYAAEETRRVLKFVRSNPERPVALRYRRTPRTAWIYEDKLNPQTVEAIRNTLPDDSGEIEYLTHYAQPMQEPVGYAIEAKCGKSREVLRLYHADERDQAYKDALAWTEGSAVLVRPIFL